MIKELDSLKKRLQDLQELIVDPSVIADRQQHIKLSKEHSSLSKTIKLYDSYTKTLKEIREAETLLNQENDNSFIPMIKEELTKLSKHKQTLHKQLKKILTPQDPNDKKNSILEIRAGTGGSEAAIWAGDLFRMYQKFAENKPWHLQVIDYTEGSSGGYKEIISMIEGERVYGTLKYESGIHRVQRVPATETQGRIHTSAASVVIMPEIDEVTINIDIKEIRKDTFCSSGPGGQSVNTTHSAVRLTHLPTGIVATCQDQKSQLKNYQKALSVLRARLHEKLQKEQQEKIGATRKSMIGTGDRSEKIRTYNYPQNRVTDHRINYTAHNLTTILDGLLDPLIDKLCESVQKDKDNA